MFVWLIKVLVEVLFRDVVLINVAFVVLESLTVELIKVLFKVMLESSMIVLFLAVEAVIEDILMNVPAVELFVAKLLTRVDLSSVELCDMLMRRVVFRIVLKVVIFESYKMVLFVAVESEMLELFNVVETNAELLDVALKRSLFWADVSLVVESWMIESTTFELRSIMLCSVMSEDVDVLLCTNESLILLSKRELFLRLELMIVDLSDVLLMLAL